MNDIERQLKPLVLYLKKEYFDQVKYGNKLEEYREIKPYWTVRLKDKEFSGVEIRGGSHRDKRTSENTLLFPWRGYSIKKLIEHPLFGKTLEVYAIKLVKANEQCCKIFYNRNCIFCISSNGGTSTTQRDPRIWKNCWV